MAKMKPSAKVTAPLLNREGQGGSPVNALIFDYGGTLDTRGRHWAHVIWDGYKEARIPVTEEQFREAYVYAERALAKAPIVLPTDNFRDLMQKKLEVETQHLVEMGVWQPTVEERRRLSDQVALYCYEQARLTVMESRETLLRLHEHYPMVLVSNFYGNIQTILQDFQLSEFFPQVIESAVVGVRKPDPAIYQLGVDAIGLPAEEVMVVGDSYGKDIVPAKRVGCQAAWFEGPGWAPEEVDRSLPDHIITHLSDLEKILL